MSKKSLLSCTTAAAVMLFIAAPINAHNGFVSTNGNVVTPPKGATYEYAKATNGGEIHGIDLKFINNEPDLSTLTIKDADSIIELNGNTIIQKNVVPPSSTCTNTNIATIKESCSAISVTSEASINMTGGSITSEAVGVWVNHSNSLNKLKNVSITTKNYGIALIQSAKAVLENVVIKSEYTGISATYDSQIEIYGASIQAKDTGIYSSGTSHDIVLSNVDITAKTGVVIVYKGSSKNLPNTTMTGGSVNAKSAFSLLTEGVLNLTNVSVNAKDLGIEIGPHEYKFPPSSMIPNINLANTKFFIKDGTGIISNSSKDIIDIKNSEIYADVLLIQNGSEKNSSILLNANHSNLEGKVTTANNSQTVFNLDNETTWFLKTSTQEKDQNGDLLDIAQRSRSDVSVLNLNDSKIVFRKPVKNHYHTLHIGSGKKNTPEVYNASGNAAIHFNMAWSDGVAVDDQKTDRVLIHGDASGTTTVYVMSDVGDISSVENAGSPSNAGGISLIQVSGKATEDSFKLANGYTTLGGKPYKYTLTAYGPTSSHGIANSEQNLFEEKNENFWDFRLHKAFLDSGSGSTGIPAPVAQTASYLDMPIALFHAGFADIKKQSTLLADIRTTQNFSFFLSPYGNTAKFTSKRGPLKYGYDADINYAAIQAGAALAEIENKDISMHLGLMGTYGQLSFTPKDIEDADKSLLNKWAITAYGTLQHNNGLYLDVLASYGMINGDITTKALKNAASVKDTNTWSASATVGKEFAMNHEGLTLEPQVQLVYQQLSFEKIKDADELKVDLKNPSQWLARIGGRLTKTVSSTEQSHTTSVYGKLNFLTAFGDEDTIQIGKDFNLDPTGTSLEGGVGINANLSQNFSIHADVSYRQKLQKAGISGADFSAGIRYQF
ncbi:autotransporter outer membrane beta-barrel domain-containing protein [Bartonella doshiae]|uniref:Type V secretory pathway, adhesin AidA n=3 Tax=Bartonella doshiae TaxID=33044 RepID=A0A380ZEK7_BARDO|nr:autotransporter outer membrane beta-barrel domain-containing protein [Bartonella doshiae]EJF79013.1 outer membrane autotransporter barrel domain-containing protein [Bartonella doshiae NCTC 12862 = ATCC 700133]MBB6160155.1 outer membrane autotransporter protein [Bartonella doshiae]SUV45409.1 Type V secretory pathway, adhesin AidA [Bartonella doshiae]